MEISYFAQLDPATVYQKSSSKLKMKIFSFHITILYRVYRPKRNTSTHHCKKNILYSSLLSESKIYQICTKIKNSLTELLPFLYYNYYLLVFLFFLFLHNYIISISLLSDLLIKKLTRQYNI